MAGNFAPRFAAEAAFVILLAVAAGFADLRPAVIIAVMAGAWILVSLIEYFAWRASVQTTTLRPAAPPEPVEPLPGWSVEEILVPESELGNGEPEQGALTTVLPREPEAEPKPERKRGFLRWWKRSEEPDG